MDPPPDQQQPEPTGGGGPLEGGGGIDSSNSNNNNSSNSNTDGGGAGGGGPPKPDDDDPDPDSNYGNEGGVPVPVEGATDGGGAESAAATTAIVGGGAVDNNPNHPPPPGAEAEAGGAAAPAATVGLSSSLQQQGQQQQPPQEQEQPAGPGQPQPAAPPPPPEAAETIAAAAQAVEVALFMGETAASDAAPPPAPTAPVPIEVAVVGDGPPDAAVAAAVGSIPTQTQTSIPVTTTTLGGSFLQQQQPAAIATPPQSSLLLGVGGQQGPPPHQSSLMMAGGGGGTGTATPTSFGGVDGGGGGGGGGEPPPAAAAAKAAPADGAAVSAAASNTNTNPPPPQQQQQQQQAFSFGGGGGGMNLSTTMMNNKPTGPPASSLLPPVPPSVNTTEPAAAAAAGNAGTAVAAPSPQSSLLAAPPGGTTTATPAPAPAPGNDPAPGSSNNNNPPPPTTATLGGGGGLPLPAQQQPPLTGAGVGAGGIGAGGGMGAHPAAVPAGAVAGGEVASSNTTTATFGGGVANSPAPAARSPVPGGEAPPAGAALGVGIMGGGAAGGIPGGLRAGLGAAGPPPPQQQQQQPPHLNPHHAPPPPQQLQHQQPQPGQYAPGANLPPHPHHAQQQQLQQPPPHQQQQQVQQAPPQQQQQQQQAGGPPGGDRGMRELRVEDALLYLDHVKMEFKDRPQIYNQFLAIMKNFKSQEVDTPGVIRRVSKLFRGYNNLILGFNTFLPDGFKISLADLQREERLEIAREEAEAAAFAAATAAGTPHQPKAPPSGPVGAGQLPPHQQQVQQQQQAQHSGGPPPHGGVDWRQEGTPYGEEAVRKAQPPPAAAAAASQPPPKRAAPAKSPPAAARGGGPSPKPAQAQPHQTVEFDHAISYVTTIKRRFSNDPSTYHQFLEILHTYQKEQRGIKEVLEQVAHLFQDHPDLLKEFTFFLPDAVQEQAKERLHRAAAESESRQALQRQQQMEQYQQSLPPSSRGAPPAPLGSHQKFIDMTRNQAAPGPMDADARGRKRPMEVHHATAAAPEANVYNSAVERQFFDAAREALSSYSRDGGQAWAEFLKCLDMYAQDILSRSEMLNFVEPLLGKRNNKLFEEFKRILATAGSPTQPLPLLEDSWHSVPLSEIDFSRCRRCSPSYRALPRDYPAPPCGGRSEAEVQILNDIWVSLPVGSEESYTFRHMRRNTYEETLFRVEDERFEIDMVIDSNAATLRRLEPIAEEIAQLSQEELALPDLGTKPAVEGAGLGGRRFQYSFDKKILGVIHRNTIARIYGDSGQEMLDLMVKNPTVAIPIVVQRLRQKDVEWKAVRDRLNRHWMELAQHNYYKSLDHRSLTWRTIDKRATSTRTLISEIKDRASHVGHEGPEALKQKLDKAKEEHGSFYEVTMKEELSKTLDLTFLPKPDRRLFTPHLSLMYDNSSWAQRDAYRILSFALERGHISPADKERCHHLWTDFLGPFFGLSLNWMQQPAVAYQESTAARTGPTPAVNPTLVSEDDDEDSMEEENDLGGNVVTEEMPKTGGETVGTFTDHHPLPAGAHVSTLYGEGKIIEFRRSDHIYVVELGVGAKGYLRPATVLCSILPVEKSPYTRQLRANDLSKLARPGDHLVIGSQSLYLFFRLHQILVRRLNIAKRLAYSVGDDRSLKTLVEQQSEHCSPAADGRRRYEAYLSLVYNLLDGGGGGAAEGGEYEDRVRGLLGHGAYELATMDKLISHIWKNLQSMAGDETMWNLVQLYRRHLAAGSFQPESFRQEAAYHSEGEAMYAFQNCPVQGQDSSVLHFEYLGVMEDPAEAMNEDDIEDEDEDDDMDMAAEEGGGGAEAAAAAVDASEPSNKRQRR